MDDINIDESILQFKDSGWIITCEPECYICLCHKNECYSDEPVIKLECQCKGDTKYVHQSCLINLIKTNKSEYCTVCKSNYGFKCFYPKSIKRNNCSFC